MDCMRCRELVELATDFMEGELPEARRGAVEAHVATCPGCSLYLGQLRAVVDVLAATSSKPPVDLDAAAVALHRKWVSGHVH